MKKLLSVLLTLSMTITMCVNLTLTAGAAVNIHDLLFDWEYYYNNNYDLQRAFGKNQSKLRQHYENYGKKEGRAPSEFFDPKVYLGLYSDLRNAFGSTNYTAAYNHFVSHGIKEQRQASNTFSIAVYKKNYEDLRKAYGNDHAMYIYHYKTYGKKEGRNPIKSITSNTSASTKPSSTSTTTVTNLENGGYYLINFKNTNMGINVQFAPKSGIGNLVLDSTSNKEGNEVWKFTYNSSYKAYYITPQYRSGAAINALYGAKAQKGSQARLHDSNTYDTASLWKIEKNGSYYRLKNVASGYYLDVASGKTSAGTKINLWSDSASNQQFTLTKVSVTSQPSSTSSVTSWQYPMKNYTVSQSWNNNSKSMAKKGRPYHSGIDMVSSNTAIFAATNGTVVYKGYSSGNGNHVILSHKINNQTVKTLYSHLSSYADCPAEGKSVMKGQKIGVMGSTGNSTGPHLHFAVFTGSSNDPYGYVSSSNSSKKSYGGCVFYNPDYVIKYNKLP